MAEFFVRPDFFELEISGLKNTIFAISLVLIIDILIVFSALAAVYSIDPGLSASKISFEINEVGFFSVLFVVLLTPLFEEVIFRGWLRGSRRNVLLAAISICALFGLYIFGSEAGVMISAIFVCVLACSAVYWLLTRKQPSETLPGFKENFPLVVWSSSVFFGLSHYGTFADFGVLTVIALTFIFVIGGVLLAYTRIRIGLRAAVVQHSAFNVITLPIVL